MHTRVVNDKFKLYRGLHGLHNDEEGGVTICSMQHPHRKHNQREQRFFFLLSAVVFAIRGHRSQ